MKIQANLYFFQGEVELVFNKYGNGRTAILLVDKEDKSPVAVATVNIPDYHDLKDDEVIIKNYSENDGMIETLQEAGVIGPIIKSIPVGYAAGFLHKLLIQP
tara:strand:+ start:375 stop:680 length:306 start_codon:yes stop_codon:yes gene_type:complete